MTAYVAKIVFNAGDSWCLNSFGRTNVCSSTLLFYTFLADVCWACSCIVSRSVLRGALAMGGKRSAACVKKCVPTHEPRPSIPAWWCCAAVLSSRL